MANAIEIPGPQTERLCAPAWHQTMQQAIGWRYNRLSPEEQAFFRDLV